MPTNCESQASFGRGFIDLLHGLRSLSVFSIMRLPARRIYESQVPKLPVHTGNSDPGRDVHLRLKTRWRKSMSFSAADLHRDILAAAQAREGNQDRVLKFFSSDAGQEGSSVSKPPYEVQKASFPIERRRAGPAWPPATERSGKICRRRPNNQHHLYHFGSGNSLDRRDPSLWPGSDPHALPFAGLIRASSASPSRAWQLPDGIWLDVPLLSRRRTSDPVLVALPSLRCSEDVPVKIRSRNDMLLRQRVLRRGERHDQDQNYQCAQAALELETHRSSWRATSLC